MPSNSGPSYESELFNIFEARLPEEEEALELSRFELGYLRSHTHLEYGRLVLRTSIAYRELKQIDTITPEDFYD